MAHSPRPASRSATPLTDPVAADAFVETQVNFQLGGWATSPPCAMDPGALRATLRERGIGFTAWDAASNSIVMTRSAGNVHWDGAAWVRNPDHPHLKARRIAAVLNDWRSLGLNHGLLCVDMEDARSAEPMPERTGVPVVQFNRRPYDTEAVLWPLAGYHALGDARFVGTPEDAAMPWRRKRPIVMWRGALSGVHFANGRQDNTLSLLAALQRGVLTPAQCTEGLRRMARYRVVEQAQRSPVIDAGFVLTPRQAAWSAQPMIAPLCRERLSQPQMRECRYLLCLEGYDTATSLYWGLNSHCVVFKQDYAWEAFADVHFKPWLHYVPVSAECADIEAKRAWCEERPDVCEAMIARAHGVCRLLADPLLRARALGQVVRRYAALVNGMD